MAETFENVDESPTFSPPLALRSAGGDAVASYVAEDSNAAKSGLCVGARITPFDGVTVAEKMEQLRPRLRVSSSHRHFQPYARRRLLDGAEGSRVALPCHLVVRVSRGYTCDRAGRIIEVNGNVPQIQAELTLDDILHGTDSVIDRAVEALAEPPR